MQCTLVAPGKLELSEKPLSDPPPGQVRIRVEACGVCHIGLSDDRGSFPIQWPRVPGHEAVGRIDALGASVEGWTVGQRVGVGFLGGSCGHCRYCRGGDLVSCENQAFTGVQQDGGYAEVMIAKASGLVSVPDGLDSVGAAPLLCAGPDHVRRVAQLIGEGWRPGRGARIGGLGHLAVQYARRMGFEVAAIGRGADKAELAKTLGAHHYIDGAAGDSGDALRALGGAKVVLATASAGKAAADTVKGLRRRGELIVVGASSEPMPLSALELLFDSRSVSGSLTGTPAVADETLKFSLLEQRRRHGRDDAAGKGRRGLRENDVGKGSLSHGADNVMTVHFH